MNKIFKQSILFGLIAAVLYACGGDLNIESAKLDLRNENYEGVIESANLALQENPNNPDGYYYKGAAYLEMSSLRPLNERPELLRQARENLNRAHELYVEQEKSGNEAESALPLLESFWANTYSEAVADINFEGANDPDSLQRSIDLLYNAIAIAPDSVMNYDAISEVYFLKEDVDNAIKYMDEAIERATEPDQSRYQRMTYFLSLKDDDERSLSILTQARERFPEEIFFIQEIANVHFRRGETEQAIVVLEELIEMDPENAEYRTVYGTQIYQEYINMDAEIREKYDRIFDLSREYSEEARRTNFDEDKLNRLDAEREELQASIAAMEEDRLEIAEIAEEQLMAAYNLDSENPNTTYALGVIHENRGNAIIEQANVEQDNQRAQEMFEEAQKHFRNSVEFYEKTAAIEDQDPELDSAETWLKLFQVYTRLGMVDEAEEAQERAGF